MPNPEDIFLGNQGKLNAILIKITTYQQSLSEDRAIELDELQRKGILSSADIDFMSAHSVSYKPHRVTDFHALDMLHMPIPSDGCVFIGPSGPPLKKRRIQMKQFETVVQSLLKLPRQEDELLLHVEFDEYDGVGISPKMLAFNFGTETWRERLPAIRNVAAEFDLYPFQDEVVQIYHILTYDVPTNPDQIAAIAIALLNRGCGLTDDSEVVYSAGALDET